MSIPDIDAPTPKAFGVGVLLVQGLTEDKRGSTLVQASDALQGCLARWITEDDREERERQQRRAKLKQEMSTAKGNKNSTLERELRDLDAVPLEPPPVVALTDVRIKEDPDDPQAPPHLTMRFRAPGQGDAEPAPAQPDPRRWCLAESWLAQDYQPPSLRVMASWVLRIAPVIVLRQFTKTLRLRAKARPRRFLYWVRLLTAFVLFLLAPLVSLLAVIPPLLALLLATLPVPKLSAAVRKSSARIGASIGDSYVLLESPARLAALVSRVDRDLKWLSQRCDRVAVVAFGQGATVTHRYLQRGGAPKVSLYVTVGSGLRKVAEVMSIRAALGGIGSTWMIPVLVAILVVMVLMALLIGDPMMLAYAYVAFVMLLAALHQLASGPKDEEPRIQVELALPDADGGATPWTDMFASFDPVSNGPIFEKAPAWLDSQEIWTNASTLNDHGAYWRNPDAFVVALGSRLARLSGDAGLRAQVDAGERRIARAARRRAWRLGWLLGLRFAVLLAALVAGGRLWDDVLEAARDVSASTPDAIAKTIETIVTPIREPLTLIGVDGDALLAGVLVLCGALVAYAPVRMLWSSWDRRDVTRFFRREPTDLGGAPAAFGVLVALSLVYLLARAVEFGSWKAFARWFDDTVWESTVWLGALSAVVLALAVTWLILWVERRRRGTKLDPEARARRYGVALCQGVIAALIIIFLPPAPSDGVASMLGLQSMFTREMFESSEVLTAASWGGVAPVLAVVLSPVGGKLAERIVDWSTTRPGGGA